MADKKFTTTLSATLHLIEQFIISLNSVPQNDTAPPLNSPSPLPLLSTCAATLRAQTTKLSLLIITPPFTPSAVSTILTSLNDAILPSLLTATLLLTPSNFTKAYSTEAITLTKATLLHLKDLLHLLHLRSQDPNPNSEPPPHQQSTVTEATGKIWSACDSLQQLATAGVAGFIIQKAEQHLELIRDAVQEIEAWDPEASDSDSDGFFDDDDPTDTTPPTEKPTPPIPEIKTLLLPTLLRIPQSLHVLIHQRLKKGLREHTPPATPVLSRRHRRLLDEILARMEETSTCIDDAAERLYMRDGLGAMLTVEKARGGVVGALEGVVEGWDGRRISSNRSPSSTMPRKEELGSGGEGGEGGVAEGGRCKEGVRAETKEDRYIKRALDWVKSVGVIDTSTLDSADSPSERTG